MAKLSEDLLITIFNLQKQLIAGIDDAAAIETLLFEQYGETNLTLPVLEQLIIFKNGY
jgi:hypothetical protein